MSDPTPPQPPDDFRPPPPPPPGEARYQPTPGYGSAGGGDWTGPPLASWGERVGAYLIDYFLPFVPGLILVLARAAILGFFLYAVAFAFVIWNLVRQGATGQTVGKQQLGIKLVREVDLQPVGAGLSIGRYFLHVVDALPCYIGFLFPLWDAKRQTFADKILATVVVEA